jgi:hypothetical protein
MLLLLTLVREGCKHFNIRALESAYKHNGSRSTGKALRLGKVSSALEGADECSLVSFLYGLLAGEDG